MGPALERSRGMLDWDIYDRIGHSETEWMCAYRRSCTRDHQAPGSRQWGGARHLQGSNSLAICTKIHEIILAFLPIYLRRWRDYMYQTLLDIKDQNFRIAISYILNLQFITGVSHSKCAIPFAQLEATIDLDASTAFQF